MLEDILTFLCFVYIAFLTGRMLGLLIFLGLPMDARFRAEEREHASAGK
jgi:hypothetical protein